MAILFHFNNYKKPNFFKPTPLKSWLKQIAKQEEFNIHELNYIMMDDESLLKINLEFLNHNTYTDIITFDHSETKGNIESDIYISLERVAANAEKFNTTMEKELHRVLAHGLLHLFGYKDKKKSDILIMRQKEDEAINLLHNIS